MPEYYVEWGIDIVADSPLDAARQARAIQLDPDSTANFFVVKCPDGRRQLVDLEDEGNQE